MDTSIKLITYDDYLQLPDDRYRYEIIEGELLMTAAPSTHHQIILGNLYYQFRNFLKESKAGEVFIAPIDVVLSMTDVVQPDLIFISDGRQKIITKKNIVAAPDLVVEIISEHTETIDRTRKKALYEKYGVKEYWIVYPDEKKIDQYLIKKNEFVLKASVKESEELASEIIKGFSLDLNEIFSS